MKSIEIKEFLNLDDLRKIRVLKDIARGRLKLKERSDEMSKVNVVETRVKEILEAYPNTRENDNLLYVTYLKEYHYIDFNEETFINYEQYGLPSFKSVERSRRRIQNESGIYKASEDIEEKRKEAEHEYRKNYGG